MTIPSDPDERRNWLVERWYAYGDHFSVFVPDEQPRPDVWDFPEAELDDKGRLDPQVLKRWEYLPQTKELLRQRYGKFHILETPALWFDCLVPKFQNQMHYKVLDSEGNFLEVDDNHEWYDNVLRMGVFKWQVGFSCSSVKCEREWCKLNLKNPHRINPIDIYSIIQVFEGVSTATALSEVAKWFNLKLRPLESRGIFKTRTPRYAVPKWTVYSLIRQYRDTRHQHLDAFLKEATAIIQSSALVEWHGRMFDEATAFLSTQLMDNLYKINDFAVKAYLWLLIRQEELARQTAPHKAKHKKKWEFRVSDAELATALVVSPPTAARYRKILHNLGLVEVQQEHIGRKIERYIIKAKY